MTLPIEKDVPLPKARAPWKYPWDTMEVGDSVFVDDVADEMVRASVQRANRTRIPKRYASRKMRGGTRIFRIAVLALALPLAGAAEELKGRARHEAIFARGAPAVTAKITFDPAAPRVRADSPIGAPVTHIIVTMSDGSQFGGTLAFRRRFGNAGGCFAIQNKTLIVACDLTRAPAILDVSVTARF